MMFLQSMFCIIFIPNKNHNALCEDGPFLILICEQIWPQHQDVFSIFEVDGMGVDVFWQFPPWFGSPPLDETRTSKSTEHKMQLIGT